MCHNHNHTFHPQCKIIQTVWLSLLQLHFTLYDEKDLFPFDYFGRRRKRKKMLFHSQLSSLIKYFWNLSPYVLTMACSIRVRIVRLLKSEIGKKLRTKAGIHFALHLDVIMGFYKQPCPGLLTDIPAVEDNSTLSEIFTTHLEKLSS